jgi:hypothetical protein
MNASLSWLEICVVLCDGGIINFLKGVVNPTYAQLSYFF